MMRQTPFIQYWHNTRTELDSAFVHWIPRFFPNCSETQATAVHGALDHGKRLRGCLLSASYPERLIGAAVGAPGLRACTIADPYSVRSSRRISTNPDCSNARCRSSTQGLCSISSGRP
jgi:hypothetical protein